MSIYSADNPNGPGRLPVSSTPLVGRESQVAQVLEILNWPDVSLLTLTGTGGVGKTRLALEVARRLESQFADGVVFVQLSLLAEASLVLPTIAKALGLRESDRPTVQVVQEFLASRQMLVVLDNFEHLLEAAGIVSDVLRASHDVTFLVTSRSRLKLYGEHEFAVPPLTLPTPEDPEGEAVKLFLERVRAIQPSFVLSADKLTVLGEICRRLDGLPLAIELAAARVRLLPPKTLLDRLGNRLKLLSDGARDLPSRQQTLRATLDWSYSLLSPPEQQLFARLAVFVGGWSLEAAEAVCRLEDDVDVFEGLTSLVEKSLVQHFVDDEARFSMLETLHEYALEKLLERGELTLLRQRHAAYSLGQCRKACLEMREGDQVAWLERMSVSKPNILAAMRYCLEHDTEKVGSFARYLGWMWSLKAEYAPLPLLEEALKTTLSEKARGWVLFAVGILVFRRGGFEQAIQVANESLLAFQAQGEATGEAYARLVLAMGFGPSDPEAFGRFNRENLADALERHDHWLITITSNQLGMVAIAQQDFDLARQHFTRSAPLAEQSGDFALAVFAQLGLAAVACFENNLLRAEQCVGQAMRAARPIHMPSQMALCLEGFAAVAALRGHGARAVQLIGAAEAYRKATNVMPSFEQRIFQWCLTPLEAQLGATFEQSLEAGRAMPLEAAIAFALEAGDDRVLESAPTLPRRAITDLTPRELEVLKLLASGLSNKQIAAKLGIGVYTINDHASSIFSKLGVPNRAAATRYALERGLG